MRRQEIVGIPQGTRVGSEPLEEKVERTHSARVRRNICVGPTGSISCVCLVLLGKSKMKSFPST